MNHERTHLFVGVVIALTVFGMTDVALASPVVQLKPAENVVTLEFENGRLPLTRTIPLYQEGAIRYFSAGVGKRERQARYPVFPLKLVFAKDTGAFLAHITVEIRHEDGELVATIPAKHVTGPWLFVDLNPGVYEIVATNEKGKMVKKRVPIKHNDPLYLPLYWKS